MLKYFLYIVIFNLVAIYNAHSDELKINSDQLEIDRNNNISIFSGSVHAFNEDINIWSENLILKFIDDENQIRELNAEKKVKIINQGFTATGERGIYYPETDTLNLNGNVEVFEKNN